MEIKRLNANDFDEAMDLLDLVFSKAHMPHDFASLLPVIYRPTDEHMRCNFAACEGGKIRGIVGMFPAEMKVGNTVLKLGGIGGVSAHPKDKGKGWMKALMGAAIEEMENTEVDISWLAGLRQRYQYFGYEKTGFMMEYTVSKTNLRHMFGNDQNTGLRLVKMEKTDSAYIEKAKGLHDRQPVACVRSLEDFWLFLVSVYTTPWVALDEADEVVGYFVVDREQGCFTEIFAENDEILLNMIRTWLYQREAEYVKVMLAPWQEKAAREIGKLAESFGMRSSGSFRIFNWEKVVGSFLKVKSEREALVSGNIKVGIKEYGTLEISVENGTVTCTKTDADADVVFDEFTACRVIFGYCPMQYIADVEIAAEKKALMNAWFPLPLCWMIQNHV